MKVFAISDLHLSINNPKPMDIFGPVWDNYLDKIEQSVNKNVGENDLLLIPGDISWAMKLEDAKSDLEYISTRLKGQKIILRGNHDYWWGSISMLRKILPGNILAIQNDAIRFDKVVICGTRGWVVPEYTHKTANDEKIYNRELLRLELSLKNAERIKQPGDKLICMMHYPPFNSKYAESDFTKMLEKYGVDIVVYGHLHSQDTKHALVYKLNNIEYYLTSCDLVNNNVVHICDIE